MALVDSETLRIEGYFEETKLPEIRVGECPIVCVNRSVAVARIVPSAG